MPDTDQGPLTPCEKGLRAKLQVQASARQTSIEGLARDAQGELVIRARVSPPPEGGKANAALLKLLAKAWGLPKSRLSVISGPRNRQKTVLASGDPEELEPIRTWLRGLPRTDR